MQRSFAAVGSALFFALAPGTVAGVVPWLLTHWEIAAAPLGVRVTGMVLIAASVPVLLSAFVRFVVEGFGTPAPIAPTERLVIGGPYRFTRNPMYLAVLSCIAGQALALGQWSLLGYAAIAWVAMASFVRWYEEPTLRRRYGEPYDEYRRAVPAWGIRLRPWRGQESPSLKHKAARGQG